MARQVESRKAHHSEKLIRVGSKIRSKKDRVPKGNLGKREAPMTSCTGRETASSETIVWEKTPCPLCGQADEELLMATTLETGKADLRVVRCKACGLAYLNPRPDQDSIARFYPEDYKCYTVPESDRSRWWGRVRKRLERLVRSHYQGDPPPLRHWYERLIALLAGPF